MATSGERPEDIDAMEPLRREPEQVRVIIKQILELEKERLYQQRPHLNEDVVRVIREYVK